MMGTDSRTMPGRSRTNIPPPERRKDAAKRPTLEVDGFSDDYLSVVAHDLRGIAQQHHWLGGAHKASSAERGRKRACGRDDHPPGKAATRPGERSRRHVAPALGESAASLDTGRRERADQHRRLCGKGSDRRQRYRIRLPARGASRSAARRRCASSSGTHRAVQQRHPFRARQGQR